MMTVQEAIDYLCDSPEYVLREAIQRNPELRQQLVRMMDKILGEGWDKF